MEGVILSEYIVKVIYIFLIVIYSFSVLYVILIMTTCTRIFNDKHYKKTDALIPFYNLYMLLKLVSVKSYFYILLFIPIGNIILFIIINSRLCRMYKKDALFGVGMFFIPSVFFRLLLKKNKKNKKVKEQVDPIMDDMTFEMDNLLSQDDYDKLNKEEVKEEQVDNVFKRKIDLIEDVPTYKAKKVKHEEEKDEIINL